MLLPVEKAFPNDPDVLAALGNALLNRNQPLEAARIFERALSVRHDDPSLDDDAGEAYLKGGDKQSAAARHFPKKALALDPLLLPDIEALLQIYRETGDRDRLSALMRRVQDAMRTGPLPARH